MFTKDIFGNVKSLGTRHKLPLLTFCHDMTIPFCRVVFLLAGVVGGGAVCCGSANGGSGGGGVDGVGDSRCVVGGGVGGVGVNSEDSLPLLFLVTVL